MTSKIAGSRTDFPAMGEVAAVEEVHAGDHVAGIKECVVDRKVGGAARIGLNIDVLDPKEGFGTLDCFGLDLVDVGIAAIVAMTGEALRVFVGEDRAHGFEHCLTNIVFAGD